MRGIAAGTIPRTFFTQGTGAVLLLLFPVFLLWSFVSQLFGSSFLEVAEHGAAAAIVMVVLLKSSELVRIASRCQDLRRSLVLYLLPAAYGLVSLGLSLGYQFNLRYLAGLYYYTKPVVFLCFGLLIGKYTRHSHRSAFEFTLRFIVSLYVLASLANLIVPGWWVSNLPAEMKGSDFRLTAIFPNPGRTSWFGGVIVAYFGARYIAGETPFRSILGTVFGMAAIYLTEVRKSLLGAAAVMYYFVRQRFRGVVRIAIYLFAGMIVTAVFWSFIVRLFQQYNPQNWSEDGSRILITIVTFQLLGDSVGRWAFGLGLGAWGGYASALVYSPLYHETGLSQLRGFSPDASSFIGDMYVAHVLGEIGIVGVLMVGASWFYLLRLVSSIARKRRTWLPYFASALLIQAYVESIGISAVQINVVSFVTFATVGVILREELESDLDLVHTTHGRALTRVTGPALSVS